MTTADSFEQYKISILNDIKRLSDGVTKLQEVVMALALEVEGLKTSDKFRSAVWGGSGGIAAATIIALIVKLIWGGSLR